MVRTNRSTSPLSIATTLVLLALALLALAACAGADGDPAPVTQDSGTPVLPPCDPDAGAAE